MNQEIKKVLPVIFLIAAIGLGWLSWQSYNDILIVKSRIKDSEDKAASLNKTQEKANELVSFAKKNPEIINKLNIALPDNSSKPNMVSVLASAAFSNGLLLKNINFIDPQSGQIVYNEDGTQAVAQEEFKTQNISLAFSGTYSSLKNFLIFAGKSLRLMDVVSIDFKSAASEKEKPQAANYDFSVGLAVYYLNKSDNIGAESKISEANSLTDLSFVEEKQFMELVSSENYIVDTTDTGDLGNKNIF